MNNPIVADNKHIRTDLEKGKTYYFCTCGKSGGQPFCDGSHKGSGFSPKAFTAEKDGPASLCNCKQTKNAPFCDGTHKQVPEGEVGKEFAVPPPTEGA